MFENVGRKVALIVLLLLTSVGLMVFQKHPFRLGLDLQGGTRLLYKFDFAKAKQEGLLGANEKDTEILQQTVEILRNRVDPNGTSEVPVHTEGTDRIVIELPGNMAVEGGVEADSTLAVAVDDSSKDALELADGSSFTNTGVVQIGAEEIRYDGREANKLFRLKRGNNGALKAAAHAVGEKVHLVNSDSIRAAIENLGELSFVLVAEAGDFNGKNTDLNKEEAKLQTWMKANPGFSPALFNQVKPEQGGPDPSIRWYPTRFAEAAGPPRAVLVPKTPAESIQGEDLARIFPTQDHLGYPAVGFEIRPARIDDFADFTGNNVNKRMAIILNDEIRSAPTLNSKLVGSGIIEGKFKDEEVKSLITVLRSGSLKLKPTLQSDERVGATLGDDYVKKGLDSSLFAMAVVVIFMVVYYRSLGVFAALALLANLIMFMGGLAFLRATLTLPGIAGIVLTVGMAVDSNILIFDRLREEAEKGRNPKQAAKAGFEKALSAIVDSNVTTFLSALILYKVGTGPVRGFAVTLMIGILTSVFAALVTTRVFVHWALSKGTQRFVMGRWMADANYDFLSKAKYFMIGSAIVCFGGLALFIALPDKEKLGIDFTGGVEAQLQTAEPQKIETMRDRVAKIEDIGESAEVKPVLTASQTGNTYTQFRVQFKWTEEGGAELKAKIEEELKPKIEKGLADLLLQKAIQPTLSAEGDHSKVELALYFDQAPTETEAQTCLEAAGLKDVKVKLGDRGVKSFVASATTTAGREPGELIRAIEEAFRKPASGASYVFAQPIPSYSQIGPQVVGQLRDNALLALILSLFITVIYIRVRFAEYSYGIAAMVALVHDVLVALAALTIGNHFGLVNGEMNLAMIAVFLTIIGYSVNDTIVIFDRVRENLPRSSAPLREVLNTSINETLSRTIMTSLTVFLVIVIQYVWNLGTGNVLESISYAMIFGTISGVYSTVYIANPIFLWLELRSQDKKGGAGGIQARARNAEEKKRKEREAPPEGDDPLLPEKT